MLIFAEKRPFLANAPATLSGPDGCYVVLAFARLNVLLGRISVGTHNE